MRLIVLSKTHAWGSVVTLRPYEGPQTRPHMRFSLSLPDNDVFSGPPSKRPRPLGGSRSAGLTLQFTMSCSRPRPYGRAELLFSAIARKWWSQTGSNRRPHACKARALPTELWPLPRSCPGCEPSSPVRPRCHTRSVVGPGRLELPTSRLSGVCSNQLSYRP